MNSNDRLILFEDSSWRGFGPLAQTRPVWELRCGKGTLADKIKASFKPSAITLQPRRSLQPMFSTPGSTADRDSQNRTLLYWNGRALPNTNVLSALPQAKYPSILEIAGEIGGVVIPPGNPDPVKFDDQGLIRSELLAGLSRVIISGRIYHHPWELIQEIPNLLDLDINCAEPLPPISYNKRDDCIICKGDHWMGAAEEVYLGAGIILSSTRFTIRLERGVKIGAGSILDADNGPIWVDENAIIEAGAIVFGPAYIGPRSIIRSGARLSGGVSLGPECRMGGELNAVIAQGYSSKQHSGYLGNAFLGEWVNLGAATDNSDLKNNYRPIEVSMFGETINTNLLHAGVFIGDFSRTAIHTRINTGTVVGVCCNLWGNDFSPKEIPAFTWLGSGNPQEYRLDKALETVRAVMPRRGKELTPALEELLRQIFRDTQDQRDNFIVKK
ncbi:MAG: putative sugar nucleotidyl transferase [Calditrichota bacterium]